MQTETDQLTYGSMLWFDEAKGYGFILTDAEERLYVDRTGFVPGQVPVGRCAKRRVELKAVELDVTDQVSCERFVTEAAKDGLDILVNAAGLALGRDPFDESSEEDERVVLETNVNGLIRMTRLALSHLREGGHVVNIGSVAGR